MKYFNYIFIAGYRAYARKESTPRFRGILFVLAVLAGYVILFLALSKRIWGITPFLAYLGKHPEAIYIVGGITIFLLHYYYSTARTQRLDEEFEQLPINVRKLWGWIAVLSILIPYSVGVYFAVVTSPSQLGA